MMRLLERVGERAFEAVLHFDAQRAIVLGDDQDRAVVDSLAADLPGFGEPHAELRDVFGLGRRQDQHRDLRALARLERGELFFERRLLRGGERAREIGDARLERRQRHLRVAAGACPASSSASVTPRGFHASRQFSSRAAASAGAALSTGAAGCDGVEVSNVTAGAVEIAASFCTVKFGFTSKSNMPAVRFVGNSRTVTL